MASKCSVPGWPATNRLFSRYKDVRVLLLGVCSPIVPWVVWRVLPKLVATTSTNSYGSNSSCSYRDGYVRPIARARLALWDILNFPWDIYDVLLWLVIEAWNRSAYVLPNQMFDIVLDIEDRTFGNQHQD